MHSAQYLNNKKKLNKKIIGLFFAAATFFFFFLSDIMGQPRILQLNFLNAFLLCNCILRWFSPRLREKEGKNKNQWNPCLSMSYIVFSFLQKSNGAYASKGPCKPGFSQSFYSVLVSKDALHGQGIRKGKIFNWQVLPIAEFTLVTELPLYINPQKDISGVQQQQCCNGKH